MTRRLHTEIEIQASPDRVWETLTDFAAYPDWNPFIVQAAGEPVPAGRLQLRMRPPGRRPTTFRPEVLEATPARRLRWLGHLFVPGLFDGEHTFTIDPVGPDRVRLTQQEEFRGLLVPPVLAFIGKPTEEGFHQMNQALKTRVEHPTYTEATQ
jgi:hypothetical protein